MIIKKILTICAILAIMFIASSNAQASEIIDTTNCPAGSAVCEDIKNTTGQNNSELFGPDGLVTGVTSFMAVITGVASVIILIYAGFTFVTSSGDTKKISTAKNTILYSAIGIVIALSAQAIVSFIMVNIK